VIFMNAGRKRAFDKQQALDKATRLFWSSGYSGTSLSDLTAALGINKPSLYSAFGNKEQLFKASVEHYRECYGAPHWQKLFEPEQAPLEARVKAYLYAIVDLVSNPALPGGCLFVKSACESGSQAIPEDITAVLKGMGQQNEQALSAFFRDERSKGQLPADADAEKLASYLTAVMYGIGVLAKNGNSQASLRAVADVAAHSVLRTESVQKKTRQGKP